MRSLDYTRQYLKWHLDKPEHIQGTKRYYQRLLQPYLPQNKDAHILDVGCGMGFALQDLGFVCVEGIDLDQGQVKSCLEKQFKVNQVDDSVEFLSKKLGKYDLILALDVIEHIPHDIQLNFVEAILNALKPCGTFICTVPNTNSTLAGRWQFIDWTHYTSFTDHSLDFLLFNGGFEDI
jgi:2-polyprenyl-3-methyl-5-hydroxy-6-metoxy-1,4-benzoquinol methylase